MRHFAILGLTAILSACSSTTAAPFSVVAGAYSLTSINGRSLPVPSDASTATTKIEVIAGRLYLGGTAGPNGALNRVIVRTTVGSTVTVDSSTATGTFFPTGATAQTSFGTATVSGDVLTLKASDGTVRLFARQ
jgi:hypothetical protein